MTVWLVGAGPGDPELLTGKASRLLGEADVVVHDRLVSPAILDLVPRSALRVDVGKNPRGQRVAQAAINATLIHHGRRHRTVVRLKGGDPFVFGRGGEEAAALVAADVDVNIVPGITSAIAAPSAAGIPVTHRNRSSAFTVVTAHEDPSKGDGLDWHALAQLGTTLVVLMGARRAEKIRARLLEAGMRGATPVAVITNATTPRQRVAHLLLDELGLEPVANPSVIVIGDVAAGSVLDDASLTGAIEITRPTASPQTQSHPSIPNHSPMPVPQPNNESRRP